MNKLDELKTQLNHNFVHLGENQTASHVFVQVPCINLRDDNDKGTIVYHPEMLMDDDDALFMFF